MDVATVYLPGRTSRGGAPGGQALSTSIPQCHNPWYSIARRMTAAPLGAPGPEVRGERVDVEAQPIGGDQGRASSGQDTVEGMDEGVRVCWVRPPRARARISLVWDRAPARARAPGRAGVGECGSRRAARGARGDRAGNGGGGVVYFRIGHPVLPRSSRLPFSARL